MNLYPRLGVVAFTHSEYRYWMTYNRDDYPTKSVFIYINKIDDIRGRHFDEVIFTGSWNELYNPTELLEFTTFALKP